MPTPTPTRVLWLGNSITVADIARATHTTPHYAEMRLKALTGKSYSVGHIAIAGWLLSQIKTLYDSYVKLSSADIVGCLCPINDFRNTSTLAATIWPDYQYMVDDWLARGPNKWWIGCTVLPYYNFSGTWTQARQDQMDAWNTTLTSYLTGRTRCIIRDTNLLMRNPSDAKALNPPYNNDDLHPNNAGTQVLGYDWADAIIATGL